MKQDKLPAWPGTAGAIGGGLVGLGTAAMLMAAFSPSMLSKTLALIVGVMLALGGLVLGVGWIGLTLAGRGGFGVAAGSFAIPAAIVTAVLLPGGLGMIVVKGAIVIAGMLLCAIGHAFALREATFAAFGVARLAAVAAVLGLGAEATAFAKQIALPAGVQYAIAIVGFGGLSLLGFALAAGLPGLRARD